jgi:hypothetical protein
MIHRGARLLRKSRGCESMLARVPTMSERYRFPGHEEKRRRLVQWPHAHYISLRRAKVQVPPVDWPPSEMFTPRAVSRLLTLPPG